MTTSTGTLLLLDLGGLPTGWADSWGQAMPYVASLVEQGAWGPWAAPGWTDLGQAWRGFYAGQPPDTTSQGGLWPRLAQAGVSVGIMNLPATWPPPQAPGWAVARLESAAQARAFTHPPELAQDLGEYQGGQLALAGRPAFKPHQRDEAFALWACQARLVWQEARRLLAAAPPRLAGLGFKGLGEIYTMFPDDPSRVALFFSQIDEYCQRLAQLLQPRSVLCLAGQAGFLAWAPGLIPPGEVAAARPWDLTPLALALLGLDIPPDWPGRPPVRLRSRDRHA